MAALEGKSEARRRFPRRAAAKAVFQTASIAGINSSCADAGQPGGAIGTGRHEIEG
jgi:hypothetical protein